MMSLEEHNEHDNSSCVRYMKLHAMEEHIQKIVLRYGFLIKETCKVGKTQ